MKNVLAVLIAILIVMSSFAGCQSAEEEKTTDITTPLQSESEEKTTDITTPRQPEEEVPEIPPFEDIPENSPFSRYKSIIEMYEKIAEICFEYDEEKTYYDMFDISTEAERKWLDVLITSSYLALPKSGKVQYDCSLGYTLKDLNNNGSNELILLYQGYVTKVIAIFSLFDGKPVLLYRYWDRYKCAISHEGELFITGSNGAAMTSYSKYVISHDGSRLELVSEYGTNGFDESNNTLYYNLVNGEKVNITETEYENLDSQRVKRFKCWEFEYVSVAKKSKDISSEALSKKLGCFVSTKCESNIKELMDEQSEGIFAIPTKEGNEYKLKVYVQNDGDYRVTTINLPRPYPHGDQVDLYCGFTSETDGYVLVFYQDEHSLSGGDPTEFLYMLKTSDAGQTWEFIEYSNPTKIDARNWVVFAYFFDDQIGMFSTVYTPIYRITTDGGKSWESISPLQIPPIDEVLGLDGHYREIESIEIVDGKYVMTVGIRYGESRTIDGGYGFYIKFVSDDLKSWELV